MTISSATLQELKAWKAFVGQYREKRASRAIGAADTDSLSLLISATAIQYIGSLSPQNGKPLSKQTENSFLETAHSLYRKCSSALINCSAFPLPALQNDHADELLRLLEVLQKQFSSLIDDPLIFGYTYQYWCAPDRKTAQSNIQSANKSIDSSALTAFTQIYTPLWVVDYILANTMLATLQPHSGSSAASSPWLLPAAIHERSEGIIGKKCESTITVLDPACGAGNFLIRAFDQLFKIQVQSGSSPDAAAENILKHQLAGAEIDPLALAVLSYALVARCEKLGVKNLPALSGIALAVPDSADDEPHSTGEATLGSLARDWQFPHPLAKQYDVVVTNPPYIGRKLISRDLKNLLKKSFPDANQDLSTAFLRRSLEFLAPAGRLGLITQASMMFLPSHGKLRKYILDEFQLLSVVDAGPGVFPLQGGEKVNSGIFIIEKPFVKEPSSRPADRSPPRNEEPVPASFFIDLRGAAEKETALYEQIRTINSAVRNEAKARIVSGGSDQKTSRSILIPPAVFYRFHKCAFNYHIPSCVSRILDESPALEEIADIRQGLATSDNNRFVKMLWEVTPEERLSKAWVPYVKGAGGERWYSPVRHAVNWQSDGQLIKDAVSQRYPYLKGNIAWVVKNEQFYFRKGLCFSFVNTKGMAVRLLPPGCIFDVGASAVFSKGKASRDPGRTNNSGRARPGSGGSELVDELDGFLLGYLNSSFIVALAASLNPTINYQVGDLKRLPNIRFEESVKARISELALECAAHKRTLSLMTDPSSWFDWTLDMQSLSTNTGLAGVSSHPALLGTLIHPDPQVEAQKPETLLSVQFQAFERTVGAVLNALTEVESAVNVLVLDSVARSYALTSNEIADVDRWTREFAASERQDAKLRLDSVFVDVVLSKRALVLQKNGFSKPQNPEDSRWLSEKLKRDSCDYIEKSFPERLTKLFYGRLPVSIT